jgi:hypothetical protein
MEDFGREGVDEEGQERIGAAVLVADEVGEFTLRLAAGAAQWRSQSAVRGKSRS